MERIMLIYLLIIILFCVKSAELSTTSTTAMSSRSTLKTTATLTYTKTTVSSNVNSKTLSPTTFHSSKIITRTGMTQNEQYSKQMTTTYTITSASKNVTTIVSLSTVNSTTLPPEPTNTYNSDDRTSISTQSNNETDSVNSTVKLSTAYNGSGGLVTFSTTKTNIGNSTFDQSTTINEQSQKHSITTYQPPDTTMYPESTQSNGEGILNLFTDVHTLIAASASTGIVVLLVIIVLIIRKKKQAKCQFEDNARNGDYKSPTVETNFKLYETTCDLDSSEYHIPSEVDNTYQTLDFTVRSHVAPKFAAENNYSIATIANINQKGDHFTKGKNAMFELKGIVDERGRNLQKTPLFHQSPSTKTIPSEETVAYCDTAIFHQEFLYDVPKNSIIDGVRNPNNNFTGEQKTVAIIPSKEINQLKSTRILKDKTMNAMDSFKEKLNMSLSKKQFRQPNAYPVNPFPPSDTEIYSFAK